MDNQKVILLGAKRYNFENNETGEIIRGCNVFYSTTTKENDNNLAGSVMNKANMPYEYFEEIKDYDFPCLATLKANISFSGKNPRLNIEHFIFDKKIAVG